MIEDDDDDTRTIDYLYDANGNTLQKTDNSEPATEITQFFYDSRNQLVQTIRGPPGGEVNQGSYDYDYRGTRVRHIGSERGDVEYYHDGSAIIDEFTDSGATLLAHYNYADRLLSLNTPTSEQYYHYSALRTTTNLTDESGATRVSYHTNPWGEITEQQGTSVNRQVFTGQEHDENTGLVYFGARYYDPDTGRFITQDSYLGEPGTPPSLHRYLYAYGNPLFYIDPDGSESLPSTLEGVKERGFKEGGVSGIAKFWAADMAQTTLSAIDFMTPASPMETYNENLDAGMSSVEAANKTARKKFEEDLPEYVEERVQEGVIVGSVTVGCDVWKPCKLVTKWGKKAYEKVKG
ncbi:MAG: RHS repeat-associated core domain-containing protein, partial [Gammaproteobacteria bacterium]|nr:RHS repeat-associated core domain-containing protein [Gammaproteobacteria bacterium]